MESSSSSSMALQPDVEPWPPLSSPSNQWSTNLNSVGHIVGENAVWEGVVLTLFVVCSDMF
jgi:hypothetical protein